MKQLVKAHNGGKEGFLDPSQDKIPLIQSIYTRFMVLLLPFWC